MTLYRQPKDMATRKVVFHVAVPVRRRAGASLNSTHIRWEGYQIVRGVPETFPFTIIVARGHTWEYCAQDDRHYGYRYLPNKLWTAYELDTGLPILPALTSDTRVRLLRALHYRFEKNDLEIQPERIAERLKTLVMKRHLQILELS